MSKLKVTVKRKIRPKEAEKKWKPRKELRRRNPYYKPTQVGRCGMH
jgi:hypothetical protein